MSNKVNTIGLVVVAVIAIIALFVGIGSQSLPSYELAGMSNVDGLTITPVDTGDGLVVGSTGSTITKIITGTGSLIGPNYTSLAASSSIPFDIAVTGVVSTDKVFAQFATSSAVGAGWLITGASASTTSGYITLGVVNNTGAAATIPASVASTTKYFIIR